MATRSPEATTHSAGSGHHMHSQRCTSAAQSDPEYTCRTTYRSSICAGNSRRGSAPENMAPKVTACARGRQRTGQPFGKAALHSVLQIRADRVGAVLHSVLKLCAEHLGADIHSQGQRQRSRQSAEQKLHYYAAHRPQEPYKFHCIFYPMFSGVRRERWRSRWRRCRIQCERVGKRRSKASVAHKAGASTTVMGSDVTRMPLRCSCYATRYS